MLVIPCSEGAFFHDIVEDFSGDHTVMASYPCRAERSKRDLESGGRIVDKGSSLDGTNAFPFGHDSSERSFAIVPRPHVFNRSVVGGDVGVCWHVEPSLVGRIKRRARTQNIGLFTRFGVFFHVPLGFEFSSG